MTLTAVSLFAGIGGFDLALERHGVDVTAAVEIDAAARTVLARHFPHTTLFPDVTKVTSDELRATGFVPERGIITAGFPCQDLSVAGRRAGLAGERSGLFFEIVRLVEDLKPRWLLLENVPGLLSSNDGADMAVVLNSLNELGYMVDPDILDAQFFGVPQRRRRVFLVCHHAESLLKSRTTTSALITAQLLIELSLITLAALSPVSVNAGSPWDSVENCVDGLRKRMQLFGLLPKTGSSYDTLLQALTADSVKQALRQNDSASHPGASTVPEPTPTGATSSPGSTTRNSATDWSTESSWSAMLSDLLSTARSFITSTPTSVTTGSQISTCAKTLLSISEYIAALSPSSPACWQPVSSASTAVRVLINYARSTDGDLFSELDGVHDLVDLVAPAERALQSLGHLGAPFGAAAQVLLEPEGSFGDFTQGGEAWPGVTTVAAEGVAGVGEQRIDTHTHTHTHTQRLCRAAGNAATGSTPNQQRADISSSRAGGRVDE